MWGVTYLSFVTLNSAICFRRINKHTDFNKPSFSSFWAITPHLSTPLEVNIKQLKHEKVTASSYRKYETIQYVGWFVKSVG